MADVDQGEDDRIAALMALNVLDTPAEPRFDRITSLAASIFDVPIALVSLVDSQRQWFKSRLGLDACETDRDIAFCSHAIALPQGAVMVVPDAAADPRFADNPLVLGPPHVRFYAGAVLTGKGGHNLGTLCVIDSKPRPDFDAARESQLRGLAAVVVDELELAGERRAADEKRRLLELAEAMSGVGHWRYDLTTDAITWSAEVYRIHGADSAVTPTLDWVMGFYEGPDQLDLERFLRGCAENRTGGELKVRIRRADDGEVRTVVAKAVCELSDIGEVTAIVGLIQDITEREAALERVRRSETRYRLLADHMGDVVTRLRLDGASNYISPAVTTLLGYDPREMAGRPAQDFVHPDDRPELLEAFGRMGRGLDRVRLQHRALRKDGSAIWVETDFQTVCDESGKPLEMVAVIRDITERRRLEDALREARDRAEAASEAKSEFLANMSHELRTPLTSVIGFSGLLLASTGLDAKERRFADRINVAGKALLSVINDVLDYSRLEVDAMVIEARPFDVRELVATASDIIQVQLDDKGLTYDVVVDDEVPETLVGDAPRLKQVLLNFLGNAAKFTHEGGVRLTVEATPAKDGQTRLRVSVIDTGIGVAPEILANLFQRFVQGDGSTTRQYGGAGLGLAISKRLIELMGGEVGAESRVGQGTTFWFAVDLRTIETARDFEY
jgi:PAS domain S-box-containing protein